MPAPIERNRPSGITILAILAGLAGIFWLGLVGILVTVVGASGPIGGLFLGLTGLGSLVAAAEGILFAGVLVNFTVAILFVKGTRLGWYFGLVDALIWLTVMTILGSIAGFVISLILVAPVMYYLTRPQVKHWFRF